MKKIILLVAVAGILILNEQSVSACSCGIPERSKLESTSEAEFAQWLKSINGAVFLGRVIKKVKAKSAAGGAWEVTFQARRYWNGPGTKRLVVYTALSEASCGVSYLVGKQYLVFAINYKGELHTGLCRHISAMKYKDLYLKKFGKGDRPKE
jgi:hypothetical protein